MYLKNFQPLSVSTEASLALDTLWSSGDEKLVKITVKTQLKQYKTISLYAFIFIKL